MAPDTASESLQPLPARLSIGALHGAYRSGALTPSGWVRALLQLQKTVDREEVWITRPSAESLLAEASRLDSLLATQGPAILDAQPLFGVPFAVKDNIDVAGIPTTAACPEFAYVPTQSATAVQRLRDGNALFMGKTNLDQFATGLVGARSPYGAVRNAVDPAYISGGSSSGSAVAVALGLVGFALGTDTAGSGRVPAGLNGIVGIKPSRGLVSTAGMVPACRTLDCVSVFAPDLEDAWRVLKQLAGHDPADAYSRHLPMASPLPRDLRLGLAEPLTFFGDSLSQHACSKALGKLAAAPGCHFEAIDLGPFTDAAALLYQGPWIAERRASIGSFFAEHPAAIDPSVRSVIDGAGAFSAEDAFRAEYRMAGYRAYARRVFDAIDALIVPTTPNHPRLDEVHVDPIGRNSQLGHYTNFVNLLDLAAVAIPAGQRSDGLPFGLTLIGPAGSDHRLAAMAVRLAKALGYGSATSTLNIAADPLPFAEATIAVAVVGAHLAGQALNWQLLECGARRTALTQTAASYRLYALANTVPAKPGLVRVSSGDGAAIEVEVWEMPQRQFGKLMSQVGAPLGIGSLELADGRWVKGFICEPVAVVGAVDITQYGGWRAYVSANAAS